MLPAVRVAVVAAATPRELRDREAGEAVAVDPAGVRRVIEAAGLALDFSKNHVTDETVRLLVELAEACGLPERRRALFAGDIAFVVAFLAAGPEFWEKFQNLIRWEGKLAQDT